LNDYKVGVKGYCVLTLYPFTTRKYHVDWYYWQLCTRGQSEVFKRSRKLRFASRTAWKRFPSPCPQDGTVCLVLDMSLVLMNITFTASSKVLVGDFHF